MASHHPVVAIGARSLANVLADIEEAHRDFNDALMAEDADAEDRTTEAETRLDDLRDEFAAKFIECTGLKLGDVLFARERALL